MMSRSTRLLLWFIVVALLWSLTPVWLLRWQRTGFDVSTIVLLATSVGAWSGLIALLVTTPPDAIKLRPWASYTLIFVASIALHVVAFHVGEHSVFVRRLPFSLGVSSIFSLRRDESSPWWAGVYLWSPVVFLLVIHSGFSLAGDVAMGVAVFALLLAYHELAAQITRRQNRNTARIEQINGAQPDVEPIAR